MAAYNLVSATASYVIARRNWSEGGWDGNNWNQVGENAILERGYSLKGDAYLVKSLYAGGAFSSNGAVGSIVDLDEAIPNDADYVYGPNNFSLLLNVGLRRLGGFIATETPVPGTPRTATYRYAKVDNGVVSGTGNAVTVSASITEGGSPIATDTAQTATGAWQERTFSFSAGSLANSELLSFNFDSPASGGGATVRRGIAISWLKLNATYHTYTTIGGDAFLARQYVVTASTGAVVVTRNPANLVRTRRFIADTGARTLVGIAAIPKKGYYTLAVKSSYSVSGFSSFSYKGYTVTGSTGTVSLSLKNANIFRYAILAATLRAFSVSGQAAVTKKGFKLTADTTTYIVSGKSNVFKLYYVVISNTGDFLVSGKVAITRKGFHLAGNRGIYTVTGRAASLYRKLISDKGTFSVSGNVANVIAGKYLSASSGNISITGNTANLAYVRKVIAQRTEFLVRSSVAYLRYLGYGFLIPDSNISQTGFTGTFADIDEINALDTDFVYGANDTAATLEVGLRDPRFLPVNGICTVKYRIAKVSNGVLDGAGNAVTITTSVYQGASLITASVAQTATGTWTQYSFTFNASSVTNWSDLRLRFVTSASGGTGQARRGGAISWARVELPLVAEKYHAEVFGGYAQFEFGNVPYILASQGNYSVSGRNADLIRTRLFLGDAASVFVTTKTAIVARSRRFTADTGSFAVTGIANNWKRGIRVLSALGQFNVVGVANNFQRSIVFNSAAGSFTITGIQATTKKGFVVTGVKGSYTATGNNANLLRNRRIQCLSGAIAITGQSAGTIKGFKVISNSGSYLVSGNVNTFRRTYVFVASKGTYIIVGYSAQAQGKYAVTSETGSYLVSGKLSFYKKNYVVTSTTSGQIQLTGKNSVLRHGRNLIAAGNGYLISGKANNFRLGFVVTANVGSYQILPGSVSWIKTIRGISETGYYQVSGNTAITIWGLRFPVAHGQYIITGKDVRLRYKRRRQKMLLIL